MLLAVVREPSQSVAMAFLKRAHSVSTVLEAASVGYGTGWALFHNAQQCGAVREATSSCFGSVGASFNSAEPLSTVLGAESLVTDGNGDAPWSRADAECAMLHAQHAITLAVGRTSWSVADSTVVSVAHPVHFGYGTVGAALFSAH